MFGAKKEKALEEELHAVKKQNKHRREQLERIAARQDDTLEQFARVTASRAQMEKDLQQMTEQIQQMRKLAESSENTAGELHNELISAYNAVGTFDVNHAVFVRQRKEQDNKITEIVENNKHFTTPMKYITEASAAMKEENGKLQERTDRMLEFSKSMSVLSLNAAIEAGRMGDAGAKFIPAAEEIRNFSEQYEQEAKELKEQLQQSKERIDSMEEQIAHLNQLLKDNNISMGKVMKDGLMSMSSYEAGQLKLKGIISENVAGRADALKQSEKETGNIGERIQLGFSDVLDEMQEQKNSIDELEIIFKQLQYAAREGQDAE